MSVVEELYGQPLAGEIDQAACRTADYATWQDNQALHFLDGEPLLLSADGYYYLRLARDLLRGAASRSHFSPILDSMCVYRTLFQPRLRRR